MDSSTIMPRHKLPPLTEVPVVTTSEAPRAPVWVEPGSPTYRRISLALFLAGFATFSLLYCVQPLLPLFAADFHIGAAQSSLALSLTTGCLALAILCAGALSEGLGRRGLMFGSMTLAALFNLLAAVVPGWPALLLARTVEGLVLGGVPAVAMAYLAEEIHSRGLGLSMGLYVGGTAFGGMIGRVGMSVLGDFYSWRTALAVISIVDLAVAFGFLALLPASRNFVRRSGFNPAYHLRAWHGHLKHQGLPYLFMTAFLVMGVFVTIYNYAGFRLMAPRYGLSQTQIGLIFSAYLFGIAASSIAGGLADRLGRAPVLIGGVLTTALGVALTLQHSLACIIGGITILAIGFFIAHSVASGWVGRMAGGTKGHAASLYLLAYYLGSSLLGSCGGWFWEGGGWNAVAGFAMTLLAFALLIALRLHTLVSRGSVA
ncbi:MAG: hypothetical protein JWR07_3481 [Nevskia sp.]|nr:hypothetical protein [Nevskia sp.]